MGQIRDTLDDNKTVWEEVSGGLDILKVGDYEIASRAYIGRFNFKGQDQQKRVGELSGGERNRLQLAKILQQGANVILLDEPSNDLDVETLRALEDAILVFPGCVMVVSHDRWFLDRIATHILSFEDETPEFFTGNYTEFEEYRRKNMAMIWQRSVRNIAKLVLNQRIKTSLWAGFFFNIGHSFGYKYLITAAQLLNDLAV